MNQTIAKEWSKRLKSKKYKEGKNLLRTKDDKYDAFGILVDIAVEEGFAIWKEDIFFTKPCYSVDGDKFSLSTVTSKIKKWAELKSYEGKYDPFKPSIVELMNNRRTFNEISKVIDENWELI